MRRNPSLHLLRSDLVKVLNELQYDKRTTGAKLADMIFEASSSMQITDRHVEVLKLKSTAKAKAIKTVDTTVPEGVVEHINRLIVSVRESLNPNVKARPIMANSKDFILLKQVAKMAYDFTLHFNIRPKTDGYKEFVELGIGYMGKYGLNKFITYENKIYSDFEDRLEVLNDDKKNETREFYEAWKAKMVEYVDLADLPNLDKNLSKYVNMLYGRREADKSNADYEDWIAAQFEGLAFLNAIPEINQFYGENSKNRYDRYVNSFAGHIETEEDILSKFKEA